MEIRMKKNGQVTYIAPLNRLPLLGFPSGGVSRSWSYKARPRGAKVEMLGRTGNLIGFSLLILIFLIAEQGLWE